MTVAAKTTVFACCWCIWLQEEEEEPHDGAMDSRIAPWAHHPAKELHKYCLRKDYTFIAIPAEVGLGYTFTKTATPWLGWAAFAVIPFPGAGVGAFCLARSRALKVRGLG
ncbi:hypothetical protein CHS0354_007012 [Potamilus streckersoni]|uniref:Uncharacterized protein n=1 Tax=Potamilus streckersoni TaxID=2493646 RepID=A0AAE0VLD9_9BIVA|nr:hypothetical protein CHS0354_007012 [Potamilus streckersoni]